MAIAFWRPSTLSFGFIGLGLVYLYVIACSPARVRSRKGRQDGGSDGCSPQPPERVSSGLWQVFPTALRVYRLTRESIVSDLANINGSIAFVLDLMTPDRRTLRRLRA